MLNSLAKIDVRKVPGAVAKSDVEAFLHFKGSHAIAREIDLFFLAQRGDEIIGSVRFCVEENTPMLRTMMIAENVRRQGIGSLLLENFRQHLEENSIENVYCLPYGHLVDFYSQIGFEVVPEDRLPIFLQERLKEYRSRSSKIYIAMKRQ